MNDIYGRYMIYIGCVYNESWLSYNGIVIYPAYLRIIVYQIEEA